MLSRERGDTLIEVLVATAVLALIIVIAIGVMNNGTAQAERSVEGTFVRQEIDSQTELLRFARDSYVDKAAGASDLWTAITNKRTGSVPGFDTLAGNPNCKPVGDNAFYLDATTSGVAVKTDFVTPATYAAPGHGLWIEATSSARGDNYLDFYLYACWSPVGNGPNSTSGTIVRLYAPTE